MRIFALLGLFAIAAAPLGAPAKTVSVPGKPICHNPGAQRVSAAAAKPGVHPLGNEPPAQQIKAVVRTLDGCNKPLVVADKVGPRRR